MLREFRVDRASLRKPERTPQGFLRVQGFATRCGVFEYLNEDGTIRRELRLPEEVFAPATMASYETAILTDGHPTKPVTPDNVKKLDVGHVLGKAWRDDDHVATDLLITDAKAIAKVERGDTGLSYGYAADLEETPGVHPVYGAYDVIQRNIVINHLAVAVEPRAGNTARIRMDGMRVAERKDNRMSKLTTSVDGHQHLVSFTNWEGHQVSSGSTSWAVAEGSEQQHEHAWIRNADGSITIADSAGHTHAILDDKRWSVARGDQEIDRDRARGKDGPMTQKRKDEGGSDKELTADEQISSLKQQLADALKRADEAEAKVKELEASAEKADEDAKVAKQDADDLRAQISAAATELETAAIVRERTRADAAEAKVARFDETFKKAVLARAKLERDATLVLGAEARLDSLTDREVRVAVIQRLDSKADVGKDISDARIEGRFDALVEGRKRNARSQTAVSEVLAKQSEQRNDELDKKRADWRDQWKQPLPNALRKDA